MDLAKWRELKGISQARLAAALDLRSRSQIGEIENGTQRASADVAIKLERLTAGQVTVAELRPDLRDVRVVKPYAGRTWAEAGAPA